MNAPNPHDYKTIYDYADALPDTDGFFSKQKTLSTFEICKQNQSAFRMFFQKPRLCNTESGEEVMGISIESFWIDKDGRIITDVNEQIHCELKTHLELMISQLDDAGTINKTSSYDEHVNTSRIEYSFSINDTHYTVASNTQLEAKLVL